MSIKCIKHTNCDPNIAAQLKNRLSKSPHTNLEVHLHIDHIILIQHNTTLQPLKLSMVDSKATYFHQSIRSTQPLLKAIGKTICTEKGLIIDATAGFGQDSFIMASHGLEVISIEQNPIIHAILECLVAMLIQKKPHIKWKVLYGKSEHWLKHICSKKQPNAIYLDPFFHKPKKSLPKNAMQWLQELATKDTLSAEELFQRTLHQSIEKIVVKRDIKAPYLCNLFPNAGSITQKSSRFDCYFRSQTTQNLKGG
ncbi:MAG: class I SAM-dependent methyltransferase [Pseudomonadota bacterium]|nr:class I SAM-dependent methyltransferase [Pseudomonadota bacterium]MEC8977671.1 class I SAM-dependent methyltransferase [Pseudomonadota bacterium]